MSEKSSIQKVIAAGFRVYRVHPQLKKITYSESHGSWKTLATYTSEKKTWEAWKTLMEDPKNISM